jgi:tRNA U34 5-methylaminomethyl-2-thiouridine-forming methyltransferase MnmC
VERKIIITEDGSHTVSIPEMGVTYHSIHGALQESQHVFIEAGFNYVVNKLNDYQIKILEIGFGTGLNALLSYIEAEKRQLKIYYETVELFPLNEQEVLSLNYCNVLNRPDLQLIFEQLHSCEWEKEIQLPPFLKFQKTKSNLSDFKPIKLFELIYFDAFDPNVQPELWTKEIFEKLFSMLVPNGILVTYSSKGDVRRALQSARFTVEKIPGPKGKREMIRATHPNVI